MNNRVSLSDILDYLALSAICFFAAGYSLFNRSFAQIHLQLPFLPFPVFIGEILLAGCFILWTWKEILQGFPSFRPPVRRGLIGAAGLGVFIFLKVLTGYLDYGPLALRNAALFYYAFFAWLAASFYNKKFFNPKVNALLFFCLLTSLVIRPLHCYTYFMFSYIFLSLALTTRIRPGLLRWFLLVFLLAFLPYLTILKSSRANILACIAGSGVFLILKLSQNVARVRFLKIVLSAIIFLLVTVFIVRTFSRPEEIASVTRIKSLAAQFQETDRYIQERQADYVMRDVSVQLYSKDNTVDFMNDDGRILEADTVIMLRKIKNEITADARDTGAVGAVAGPASPAGSSSLPSSGTVSGTESGEPAGTKPSLPNEPTNNILWRLLVWRDMLRDVSHSQPVFGMPFGLPFRSSSIEILGWNKLELEGVGWMEPHNSYVHVLYRAGCLGLGLIGYLLLVVIRLALRFVRFDDGTGPFLIAVLVYWLVVANFLVTLELPFFAIPFWSLMGLTWAYGREVSAARILPKV